MIGSTLGSIVLAGVLSTFLMLSRSGVSARNYATMDYQVRIALEQFAQDVRMASDVTWNSASSVTLTVPENYTSTSNEVTYAWDNTAGSSTYQCFYRMPGDASAGGTRTRFVSNVTAFSYSRYDRLNAAATSDDATKRIQIAMTVTTSANTAVAVTDQLVSASFILRNKPAN